MKEKQNHLSSTPKIFPSDLKMISPASKIDTLNRPKIL